MYMKNSAAIKKIIALLITAALLSGCAGGTGTGEGTTTVSTSSASDSTTSEEKTEETEATTPAVSDLLLTLSKGGGIYAETFSLEMQCKDAKEIYYTTDGSDPRTSDTRILYDGGVQIKDRSGDKNVVSAVDPILFSGNFTEPNKDGDGFVSTVSAPDDDDVDKCTVIRAAASDASGAFTLPVSETYFIGTTEEHIEGLAKSCEAAGTSLSVISISMEYDDLFDSESGIYVKGAIFDRALESEVSSGKWLEAETARQLDANYKQRGSEWERAAHVDFFEFDKDGAENVLSQDCGIRIQGNYSRSDLQKGLRLYASSDYGEKNFKYAFFGDSLVDINGEVIEKFDTLELRAGGNCAFTAKFNDIYWQTLCAELDVDTKASRPCVVYLNGEYWGLYILEEDYSDDYYADHYGVKKDDVIVYKGDAETYERGYKLDEGELPDGVTDEGYYFKELTDFFASHTSLENEADFEAFSKLVDTQSVMDYFAAEIWINNKWDWPGKNWSMWRTVTASGESEYADGKWRFSFYDMEFGGVSGEMDAYTNTVKEDNYKKYGLLDMDTDNPAVLCYAYLMTNEAFRTQFNTELLGFSSGIFEKTKATDMLALFKNTYSPLYDQFFARYPGSGTTEAALNDGYASIQCIRQFLEKREDNIEKMTKWINKHFE